MHGFINKIILNLKNVCVLVFGLLYMVTLLVCGHWSTISTAIKHGSELLAPMDG